MARRKVIVGISGATGVIYGIRLLEVLSESPDIETHLIITEPAKQNIAIESGWKVSQVEALASYLYSNENVGAAISSGSFKTEGIVVCPCSIKTMSSVASSYNNNLLVRAALPLMIIDHGRLPFFTPARVLPSISCLPRLLLSTAKILPRIPMYRLL